MVISESQMEQVRSFRSAGGAQVYQIKLDVFPGLSGYVYLVLHDGMRVLIDSGSGFGDANEQLEKGLQTVSQMSGQPTGLADLTHILITHGHIDHFGGLAYLRPRTTARIGVHELDLRNLTNYEERLALIALHLKEYLIEAGVPAEMREPLFQMYMISKSLYHSVQIDFTYEAVGMRLGPFEMLHVPGHCPGHVAIRLHDILFSGDHVLNPITPHQAPESLTLYTGLDHYLKSLSALKHWAGDVRLTLGGHNNLITDLPARIDEITGMHRQRLDRVLELLDQPGTIAEVAQGLFGDLQGYNALLAIEEAGAHVEYLYQFGLLGVHNLAEIENQADPVAIRYFRLKKDRF
jgi:glyoxylase-like metal-dependent hydrolase (beta-lactamase superfamily II)